MNTVPVTFSLPAHVHRRLLGHVPPRKRSKFVSEAINTQIISDKLARVSVNPWKDFLDLGKKLKINANLEQIVAARNSGRE